MIVSGNNELREVYGITLDEKHAICNFIQGAVYCWCKNRKYEWFSLRELMGGDNYYWNETPLISLYNKHVSEGKNSPEEYAGRDAGWLLKRVIINDSRKFETKKEEMTRKYKWIDDACN